MDKLLLGYRNYKSRTGKQEFYAEDFRDAETLRDFLDELDCMESDLTPAGKKFLLDPQNKSLLEALGDTELVAKILKLETNEMAKFMDWVKKKQETTQIKYEEVVGTLEEQFGDFKINEEHRDLPYVIAGDFARYLLEAHKAGHNLALKMGLTFIEELHVKGDEKTKELATIGFLEGIQNYWGNNGADPEMIFEMLGPESKKSWEQLNKFWNQEK